MNFNIKSILQSSFIRITINQLTFKDNIVNFSKTLTLRRIFSNFNQTTTFIWETRLCREFKKILINRINKLVSRISLSNKLFNSRVLKFNRYAIKRSQREDKMLLKETYRTKIFFVIFKFNLSRRMLNAHH